MVPWFRALQGFLYRARFLMSPKTQYGDRDGVDLAATVVVRVETEARALEAGDTQVDAGVVPRERSSVHQEIDHHDGVRQEPVRPMGRRPWDARSAALIRMSTRSLSTRHRGTQCVLINIKRLFVAALYQILTTSCDGTCSAAVAEVLLHPV